MTAPNLEDWVIVGTGGAHAWIGKVSEAVDGAHGQPAWLVLKPAYQWHHMHGIEPRTGEYKAARQIMPAASLPSIAEVELVPLYVHDLAQLDEGDRTEIATMVAQAEDVRRQLITARRARTSGLEIVQQLPKGIIDGGRA